MFYSKFVYLERRGQKLDTTQKGPHLRKILQEAKIFSETQKKIVQYLKSKLGSFAMPQKISTFVMRAQKLIKKEKLSQDQQETIARLCARSRYIILKILATWITKGNSDVIGHLMKDDNKLVKHFAYLRAKDITKNQAKKELKFFLKAQKDFPDINLRGMTMEEIEDLYLASGVESAGHAMVGLISDMTTMNPPGSPTLRTGLKSGRRTLRKKPNKKRRK